MMTHKEFFDVWAMRRPGHVVCGDRRRAGVSPGDDLELDRRRPINLTTPTRTNKRSCRLTRFRVRRAPITATANALGLGDADAALGR